jgi:hypothetical protein
MWARPFDYSTLDSQAADTDHRVVCDPHTREDGNVPANNEHRFKKGPARRATRFVDAIKTHCDTAMTFATMDIPYLTGEQIATILKEAATDRKYLLELEKKLKELASAS